MPKGTFFNLPSEKRQRIIDLAIDEFAENPYRSASISRIVARAGIAKGSFYQYFENKKDLYLYLIDLAAQKKMEFFQQNPAPDPQMGVFDYLRWLFKVGARFEFDNPGLNKIGYQAIYGDAPMPKETVDQIQDRTTAFYRELLQQGITQGDIDPHIDLEAAAFIFAAVSVGLGDYILRRLAIPSEELLNKGAGVMEQAGVEEIYKHVMGLLEHGMAKK